MKYLGMPQSGSYAATTAARNHFGQYYRARSGRGGSSFPTTYMTAAAHRWTMLTDAQRAGWDAWASEVVRVGRLGYSYPQRGRQAYIAQYILALRTATVGWTPLVDPPVSWELSQVIGVSVVDAGSGVAQATVHWLGDGVMESETTSFPRPESAGVQRPPGRGHYWRVTVWSTIVLGPGPHSYTYFVTSPPSSYTPGSKTWVRARIISLASRRAGPWVLGGPAVLA